MSISLLVFIRSLVSFIVLFIFTRFIGKQQLSQLTAFEYLVGITIGSIASAMSIELEIESINGVVGLAVWGLIPIGLALLTLKLPIVRRLVQGEPRIIIRHGHITDHNLRKERLDLDQLLMLLRQKNIFTIADVEFAIMEVNGQLSVLPKSTKVPLTPADLKLPTQKSEFPETEIMDGKINKQRLLESGFDTVWLTGKLSKLGIADPSEVMLAQIHGNELYVDRKGDWQENINPGDEKILANFYQLHADFHQYQLLTEDPEAKKAYGQMKRSMEQMITQLESGIGERRS